MIKHDWPFAVLAALALALVLTNLGADYLWADEGDTAVFAQNVLKFGVPKSWDGRAFVDYEGRRTNDRLIMVGHPWAQYYIAAGSLAIFGRNAFAVRLPFALAGWMSILLVYGFVRRITAARSAAFCAAALMTLSIPFLLYCRQARYYGVSMLLTVAMFWIFFKMKSLRQCLALAFCAIVLFHCMPFGIPPYVALGLTAFLYRPWAEQRRWFLISIPIVAVFTLPWLALARTGYSHDVDPLPSIAVFFGRCLQYVVECASVTPVIGIAILFLFCLARAKRGRDARHEYMSIFRGDEFAFLLATVLTLLCYAGAIAFTKSGYGLWLVGIRYTAGDLPLVAIAAALLIEKAAGDRPVLWLSLLLIFVFTKFAQLTPWPFTKIANFGGNEIVEAHVPFTTSAR
ncbi:MAG: hypothetical protein QOG48_1124, partial [Verrucomicrobiota bacterium]